MEDETESSTDTSLHEMSRNETKSLKLDQKAVVNLRKLSPSEYLIAEDFEFEDDGDKTAKGDLESSYPNLSQGIIEDIFSPNQPQLVDELCKVLEDLVNIDFNDIETPNDIGEADDLEATFTLENMELDIEDNIDTSILFLNANESAESDIVKINLKEDEIIETSDKFVTVEEETDKASEALDSEAIEVPTSSDKTVNLDKEENNENALDEDEEQNNVSSSSSVNLLIDNTLENLLQDSDEEPDISLLEESPSSSILEDSLFDGSITESDDSLLEDTIREPLLESTSITLEEESSELITDQSINETKDHDSQFKVDFDSNTNSN